MTVHDKPTLNEVGQWRLSAVQRVLAGESQKQVAQAIGVHPSTLWAWLTAYREGQIEQLNTYRKPRPSYVGKLDPQQLADVITWAPPKYHARLNRLLRLAKGEALGELALACRVSAHTIMNDRRLYLAGKLPPRPSTQSFL